MTKKSIRFNNAGSSMLMLIKISKLTLTYQYRMQWGKQLNTVFQSANQR